MTVAYGFCMTLIIASRFGTIGLFVFTVFWATVIYRATSSRRTVGGKPAKETERSAEPC